MLNLTMKKSEPLVLHVGGVPIARITIPPNAKHSQLLVSFLATNQIKIDRESIFKLNNPETDPLLYLQNARKAA